MSSVIHFDTYDTEAAARTVGELARMLAREGMRIDSGDLASRSWCRSCAAAGASRPPSRWCESAGAKRNKWLP